MRTVHLDPNGKESLDKKFGIGGKGGSNPSPAPQQVSVPVQPAQA